MFPFLCFFFFKSYTAPSLTLNDEPHSSDILNGCIEESLENDTASEQVPTSPSNQPDYTSTDPGCWGCIKEAAREYWIEKGPLICQNRNADFSASEKQYKHQKRSFSKSLFTRKLANGESVSREWMLYSPSKGCAFCFVCLLFSEKKDSPFSSCGFNDWKHAQQRVAEHESSESHHRCMFVWASRTAEKGQIDNELREQFQTECNYWVSVLQRVVAVVKFLAERGLAFRGETHVFGQQNNGNYLGLLELISQFDPFLSDHIARFGNAGRGTPSYLSTTTCEEFVQLMGEKVYSEIINRSKLAKYFAISVDSTPDIAHTDQMTVIMRYISPEGMIQERFVTFLPITSHTGESIFNSVIAALNEMDIDVQNCRGQCYDNASNMAGLYKGVQARIREINPLAEWVPCAAL